MTARNSNKNRRPKKPYPGFALWAHQNGQWAKKIGGKIRFFGVWADPQAALSKYREDLPGILAGDERPAGWTVKNAIDAFLERLEHKVGEGDASQRHFDDCLRTGQIIVKVIPKDKQVADLVGADFFKLKNRFALKQDKKKASVTTRLGHVRRTRAIFNFSVSEGMVDRVFYGKDFGAVTKHEKAQLEASSESKMLDAADIVRMIDAVPYRLRAMILLGINCGLGNKDIATLEFGQLDLVKGWLENDRTKTAVRRCSKLWPETLNALEEVTEKRFTPERRKHAKLVFITRYRQPYDQPSVIASEFRKWKEKLSIEAGGSFYTLRHTCRTIAEEVDDASAAKWIMGHKRTGEISSQYVHRPPRERIEAVCNHVRAWLFAEGSEA